MWQQSVKQNWEVTVWGILCGCEMVTPWEVTVWGILCGCEMVTPWKVTVWGILCGCEMVTPGWQCLIVLGWKINTHIWTWVTNYSVMHQLFILITLMLKIMYVGSFKKRLTGRRVLSPHHISNAWGLKNTKLGYYLLFVCSMHNISIALFL